MKVLYLKPLKAQIDAMSEYNSDIIIVGGGLTGGLAALALASRKFSVQLIESQPLHTMTDTGFDGRTTAIAYASMRLFRRLGLWDDIANYAEPIRDILVTDGTRRTRFREGGLSTFHMHFDSSQLDNATPLGWIVENHAIRKALLQAMTAAPDINIHAPAHRNTTEFDACKAIVNLDDGRELTSSLVLAADGRNSALRSETGIRVNHWRYSQIGLVATIAHEKPHDGFAQEYFLPSGPFAILPMKQAPSQNNFPNRSSLVWTETKSLGKSLLSLEDSLFKEELETRFGSYLGDLSLAGPRFSYPLAFHLSHEFAKPRLALIGDAARAIHPIAGQGFNLGIKDIAALTDVLDEARGVGLDIGHMTVLQNYQQWRRFDSVSLALGTDFLNRLFSNNSTPVRLARTIGLGAVNATKPLRNFFMQQAGADVGQLPSLLQPE